MWNAKLTDFKRVNWEKGVEEEDRRLMQSATFGDFSKYDGYCWWFFLLTRQQTICLRFV